MSILESCICPMCDGIGYVWLVDGNRRTSEECVWCCGVGRCSPARVAQFDAYIVQAHIPRVRGASR